MTRRRDRCECGQALTVAVVLLFVIVLLGGGLIFDGARYMSAQRHASNTAEGAARAAVATGSPAGGWDGAVARQAAIDHATAVGIAPADVIVSFPTPDTIVVTITEHRTAVFTLLAGSTTFAVSASGHARCEFA